MFLLLYPNATLKLIKNCIQKLKECILTFNDFAILTPVDENNEIYQNYENLKFNSSVIDNNNFQLKEVDYVDYLVMTCVTPIIGSLLLGIVYGMHRFLLISRNILKKTVPPSRSCLSKARTSA